MEAKVYFRVDGNAEIGFGHIFRCIALAEMLATDFSIYFFSKDLPKSVKGLLLENKFKSISISDNADFIARLTGEELVVIDNYYFDLSFQDQIKATGASLICIDDLCDRQFNADLIINHAPGIQPQDYKTAAYTQFALGLDYVLLRAPFLNAALGFKNIVDTEKVCICFGGSDPKNLTEKVLKIVSKRPIFTEIHVITGPGYQHSESLNELMNPDHKIVHHHAICAEQMIQVMSGCGTAIVPTSGIFLEALALKCDLIAGFYVANQRHLFQRFKAEAYFTSAEDFSEPAIIDALEQHEKNRTIYTSPIDGKSGQRILKIFKALALGKTLTLRKATTADTATTFSWTSDRTVRKYAYSKNAISYENHQNWFHKKIADTHCLYFILEDGTASLGSVRFDLSEGEAVISYLIDPSNHGNGLGTIILKKGIEALLVEKPEIIAIIGDVMPKNIASKRAFEKLGFTQTHIDQLTLRFSKECN